MQLPNNPFLGILNKGKKLAHLLCTAANMPASISLMQGTPNHYLATGGWVGPTPPKNSRAPYAAGAKAFELLWKGAPRPGQVLCTPTDLPIGLGWMGGVRNTDYIVGVSKWAQEHDKLLALIILYGLQHHVTLHHVGFRYSSKATFYAASRLFGTNFVDVPALDHMRHYHHVVSDLSPVGEFWKETQYFPNGPHSKALHWDLATEDPIGMLNFVASAYGEKPVIFNDTNTNDPVGLVWVEAGNGEIMGLMTRYQEGWSDPATW